MTRWIRICRKNWLGTPKFLAKVKNISKLLKNAESRHFHCKSKPWIFFHVESAYSNKRTVTSLNQIFCQNWLDIPKISRKVKKILKIVKEWGKFDTFHSKSMNSKSFLHRINTFLTYFDLLNLEMSCSKLYCFSKIV